MADKPPFDSKSRIKDGITHRLLCVAAVPFLFTASSLAQSGPIDGVSIPPATAQVTAPIQDNNLTQLSGNLNHHVTEAQDGGRVADNLPQDHILMMLRRTPEREQALRQYMTQQYDPRSANYHHWLTPGQVGESFGASDPDVNQVTRWLTGHGFKINSVAAGHTFIDFSGTAGQLAQAFHTEIHQYRFKGQIYTANSTEPSIPAALAPVVAGFRSLSNFHPQPLVRDLRVVRFDKTTGKWTRGPPAPTETNPTHIVGPRDFAKIYRVNKVWKESASSAAGAALLVGTGQTIGVVGDTELASADIQTFRDEFGITRLGPNGSVQVDTPPSSVCAPPASGSNDPEGYLDAEWSGAMAPDATIDFVACGNQGTTSGADLAATYIVQDPAHAQTVSVLSTSYGDCEALPQSEANQFYVSLWQQAALEGITVVVATGDTGADGCQDVSTYGADGISVDNEASTPYNIAAGGTDFSDIFSGTASAYWSPTAGPDYETAESYIPETAWNDSCGSPLVLERYGQGFISSAGPDGFCTYAAEQPINPLTGYSPYFYASAGSGGLSVVSSQPDWQQGVPGIPQGGGRALPDISMFASGGLTWGTTLILCDSGLGGMPAGTACDFSDAGDVYANEGGGTSFVAPAFAGIMALIDQKSGSRQGQADYVLYPLAAEQYTVASSRNKPSLATCAAYLGTSALSSCYFHDISSVPNPDRNTAQQVPFYAATTAVPCTGTATSAGTYTDLSTSASSNSENCYNYEISVTSSGGSLITTPDYYGTLATADNAASPAFPATPGYDLATGLGSPDVYTLVNAPEWSSGGLASAVTLTATSAPVTTKQSVVLEATVSDQGGETPLGSGTVTFYSGSQELGSATLQCGDPGIASLSVRGSKLGDAATYTDVFAFFSGGAQSCPGQSPAAFYGAQSKAVTVVVEAAPKTK